jgi:hypothetical protein
VVWTPDYLNSYKCQASVTDNRNFESCFDPAYLVTGPKTCAREAKVLRVSAILSQSMPWFHTHRLLTRQGRGHRGTTPTSKILFSCRPSAFHSGAALVGTFQTVPSLVSLPSLD